jgi:hypothetical protein
VNVQILRKYTKNVVKKRNNFITNVICTYRDSYKPRFSSDSNINTGFTYCTNFLYNLCFVVHLLSTAAATLSKVSMTRSMLHVLYYSNHKSTNLSFVDKLRHCRCLLSVDTDSTAEGWRCYSNPLLGLGSGS